ncbi:hypothetical protein [Flavobacterium sp. DSR2-3-3]|uniref:hypothetical protein n=1 Tax=Flavobacterium sp. DSR2-3-3 TaxID=2804632 RepID=UPI003CF13E1D
MPFIFQVLGEYVIEILEVLERQINEITISNYQKFVAEKFKFVAENGKANCKLLECLVQK